MPLQLRLKLQAMSHRSCCLGARLGAQIARARLLGLDCAERRQGLPQALKLDSSGSSSKTFVRRFSDGPDGDGPHPLHGWGFSSPAWDTAYRLPRSVVTGGLSREASELGLVKGASVAWTDDRSSLNLQRRAHLLWEDGQPRTVLIVKKANNARACQTLQTIAEWLQSKGLKVLVERSVQRAELPQYSAYKPELGDVDFCISLGGDGTVLHLTSLFLEDQPLPPVVSFAMGTLGFLTPFDVADFEDCLTRVLDANAAPVYCTLRTRKRCEVYREGELLRTHHVLNECLVDRGASPSLVCLECYIDGHHITSVQADGLIIATPSGSTAYSMAAGGPMAAPSVPCTLLTPIAPHSLSFRPLVVPESSEIEIYLPSTARSLARASFDGRHTMRMQRNTSIRCTTSTCALPMINSDRMDRDWYEGIVQKLKWNVPIRDENSQGLSRVAPSRQALGQLAPKDNAISQNRTNGAAIGTKVPY